MSEIVFPATVYKVQTTVDGGIRITLDLPEDCIAQMAMLAETKRQGVPLRFVARVDVGEPDSRENNSERRKR